MFFNPVPTLFVWDFDNTIVLEDTDRKAVSVQPDLVASHIENHELVRQVGWTSVINGALAELAGRGHTPSEILAAVSQCYLPQATIDALRDVATSPNAESAIVSDSNSAFIEACLTAHSASHLFARGVFTNHAILDDNVLQVVEYSKHRQQPHTCPTCPQNLCKGLVISELIHTTPVPARMVYIGDGSNDFCAVRQLRVTDVVLYRKGFALESKIRSASTNLLATCRGWDDANTLRRLVLEILRS